MEPIDIWWITNDPDHVLPKDQVVNSPVYLSKEDAQLEQIRLGVQRSGVKMHLMKGAVQMMSAEVMDGGQIIKVS